MLKKVGGNSVPRAPVSLIILCEKNQLVWYYKGYKCKFKE